MRKRWIALGVVTLLCAGMFAQSGSPVLDIDGNGAVDALTDGLLVLRYLFGFRGATLTAGAVASDCVRCDAEVIEEYLGRVVAELDIDGNGAVDALTDGLLILRYLFGFRNEALITGAVGGGCSRCEAPPIELRLEELVNPSIPAGTLYAVDPIVGNLRYVPAGTFTQGSPAPEPCREPEGFDEKQFTHTLTRGLAVMETEMTRRMWAELQAVRPSLPDDPTDTQWGAGMDNPVQSATWYEAVLFANLLSLERGLAVVYYTDASLTQPLTALNDETETLYVNWSANGYRLPTEGEWEYFTRAGTTTPFWIAEPNYTTDNCGIDSEPGMYPQLESAAWFRANRYDPAGDSTTKPVGLKEPNPWALKDVHGNVWEWVWDWYGVYPSANQTNYRGAAFGAERVLRGGGWPFHARSLRSAYRGVGAPSNRYEFIGFRLVRSVN